MQKLIIRTFVGAFLLAILLATTETGSQAQKASGRAENALAEMTTRLVSMRNDGGNSSSLADLARERYEMLEDLIESDPSAVLRYALPEDVIKTMPDTIRGSFEERAELEGDLEILAECEDADGRTLYFLRHKDGRLPLYFAKQPETELLTGDRVRVRGVLIGDLMAVEQDGITAEQKAATDSTESAITGEITVLVFLVNFQNDTRTPYTRDQANNLMFNASNTSSVTNYYREASYGQAWVTGTTVGWYTLPMDADCSRYGTMATLAREAATNAGVNTSAYTKHMFVFPSLSCGWSGYAMVGGRDSWNNASLDLRTVTHEVGHNLGLQHARMLACAGTTVGGTCSSSEYGHMIDMMGRGTGHFHPYQKERLGWLGSGAAAPITTVQSSGTYVIAPYAANNGGSKALRILRSTDSNGRRNWYYLEFRRPIGFDTFMTQYSTSNLSQGPIFTLNNEVDSRENYQLDMNPSTTSFGDSALAAGQSYTDLVAGVTITTLSADSTGTVVSVTFSGSPTPSPSPSPSPSPPPAPQCTLANPEIAASPAAIQSVSRGGVVAYSLSIRNNNGTDCGANSFELSTFAPAGWTVTSSKPTITISPGATASASVSVSPGQTSNTGPATVTFRVVNSADPGFAATVSRDLHVSTSLVVEVSPNSAVYSPGQTVTLRATVRHDGIPVAGVAVSFTINGPSRRTVSLSGTTDSSGNAAASYRMNRKQDPVGIYQVSASTSVNGVTGAGVTSFTVR